MVSSNRTTPTYAAVGGNFGQVAVGSTASASVDVDNPNPTAVRIASARIVPPIAGLSVPPAQFPVTIAGSGSGTVQLDFAPTSSGAIPPGTIVELLIDDPCPDTLRVVLSGEGIESDIATNRGAIPFGKIFACQQMIDTVVLTNVGTTPISIINATTTPGGSGFSIVAPLSFPISLLPDERLDVVVEFAPGTGPDGIRSETLRIETSDPGRQFIDVALSGERVSEALTTTPPAFAATAPGSVDVQTVQLANDGSAPITINNLQTSGPFTIVARRPPTPLPVVLQPGETMELDVEFRPDGPGTLTGELRIDGGFACSDDVVLALQGDGSATLAVDATWGTVAGKPGEIVTIPLTIDQDISAADLTAYRLELAFNRTMLKPLAVRLDGTLSDGWTISEQTFEPGRVAFTATGTAPIIGPGVIAQLDALVLLGDAVETPVTDLPGTQVLTGNALLQVSAGTFTLEGYCQAGGNRLVSVDGAFGMRAIRPNPASSQTEVEFELIEHGPTELALFDVLGRRVRTVVADELEPTAHVLSINLTDLPSGIYILELRSPSQVDRVSVVVAR
jgi:hypothetical protein